MAVTTPALSESHYPADQSDRVLDTTVGGILREAAEAAPDQLALIGGHPDPAERRRWTFGELLEDAERCARALLARFEPGERVAVWAPNVPEWEVRGVRRGAGGPDPRHGQPRLPAGRAQATSSSSPASAGIFLLPRVPRQPDGAVARDGPRRASRAARGDRASPTSMRFWRPARRPSDSPMSQSDDPVQIQYTSGTTGFPKGALLHHRGLTNNARMTLGQFDFAPGEAYVNPFPLFHTAGCGLGVLGCVSHQLAHVPVLAFEPGLVLDLIEAERATALAGVPTVLIALTEDPGFDTRDLSSVRAALSGGALVAPDLVKRIEERLGVRFSIIYGQTESSPVITQGRLDDSFEDRATTVGRPLPADGGADRRSGHRARRFPAASSASCARGATS